MKENNYVNVYTIMSSCYNMIYVSTDDNEGRYAWIYGQLVGVKRIWND